MMIRRCYRPGRAVAAALLLMMIMPAAAETVRGARALDGDTLSLEDGRELRLASIQAPKPLRSDNRALHALADAARAALATLTEQRTLTLQFGSRPIDRHGRLVALVSDADGNSIQGALVARGLARVAGG